MIDIETYQERYQTVWEAFGDERKMREAGWKVEDRDVSPGTGIVTTNYFRLVGDKDE